MRGLSVPLCDLQAQYRELRPDIEAAVLRVLASGQVILGPEVTALEDEVAGYCGAGFGIGCSSGSDALSLALAALEVGPGDEVIVPTFTFFATAGAVARLGARPVFVDIDPDSWNLDLDDVARKITPRTKVVMPVHLFGQCVEMEPLWRMADKHGFVLIEDAAQAIGAEYQGKRAGTLGSMACFSFYPSKNLGAFGDAGMVVTSDLDWAERLKALRVHGMEPRYHHHYLGWNARIDALQAAILRVKLPYIDAWTEGRQQAAARYDALLSEYNLTTQLRRPKRLPHRRHVFNQYVLRVADDQRDALVQHMKRERVGCEVYYPIPLHLQKALAYLGYQPGDFPVAEAACREVMALPMFPEITMEQQRRVVQVCAEFVHSQTSLAAA